MSALGKAVAEVVHLAVVVDEQGVVVVPAAQVVAGGDRKSTRLNSSHALISYAVFCLKKKKTKE